MGNIGYCCINISINEGKKKKEQITVNRGMTKKTFETKGLGYVSELAMQNINDLEKIIQWNVRNNIFVYRMSSDMFPCIGFYKLEDLPNFKIISNKLKSIGDYSKSKRMRLSFHPTHFCVPASENPVVVKNAIDELDKHAQIMDLMGLEQTHYYPINIHVNTTQPTREEAADRFCKQFLNLSDSCQKRLVVENDDGPNQYSTKILYDLIYKKISNQSEEKVNEMFLQLSKPLQKFKDIEDSSISFDDGDVKVEGKSLKEAAKLQLMTQTRITEYIKLLVPADENGSMQDITYEDISAEWPLSVQLALVEKIGEVISPTYKESRGN